MRFLIDADLPRSAAALLIAAGHEAEDVRDVGLRSAPDQVIAAYAKANRLCLVSGDFGFADVRNYPPDQYAGLVVPQLPKHATEQTILQWIAALLAQPWVLAALPGRLAIVSGARIRLRPP